MTGDQERLRAVVEGWVRSHGWRTADLARAMGGSRQHTYRMMGGKRPISPAALERIAEALGTTAMALRSEAGLLTPEEEERVRRALPVAEAIKADPFLRPRQKDALIEIYEDLRRGAVASVRGRSSVTRDKAE